MSQIKGKQLQDDSLDLSKLKGGSKLLPDTATLGSSKTVEQFIDGNEFVTKDFVDTEIESASSSFNENISSEASTRGEYDAYLEDLITNIDLSAYATTAGLADEASTRGEYDLHLQNQITDVSTDLGNLISSIGVAEGIVPLDVNGKVAESFLPDSIVGQVEYQGVYNASTEVVPSDATAGKGHYYIISVAGVIETIDYAVGDWIISNGVTWNKVDNSDAVTTVHGRMGNIVANTGDYTAEKITFDGVELDNYSTSGDVETFISETDVLLTGILSDISNLSTGSISQLFELDVTGGTCGVDGLYSETVTFTGVPKTDADVFVNGIKIDTPEMAFFGTAGNAQPQVGDALYFDEIALGYTIESDDRIEIKYGK